MTMTVNDAKEFGKKAFKKGIKNQVIKDLDFMNSLPEVGKEGVTPKLWKELFTAWDRGYTEARILDELGFTND